MRLYFIDCVLQSAGRGRKYSQHLEWTVFRRK